MFSVKLNNIYAYVNENNVGNHISQVQYFAEEISKRVAIMCSQTFQYIVH